MSTRVALITGGARGIGRAIALDLAEHGWSIGICYRTSHDDARTTAEAIESRGGRAIAEQCDVSDPQAGQFFVKKVHNTWGRLDALIHGAGPYHRINIFEESVDGWREMFDHNLHPVFYLSQAAAPIMKAQRFGRIVAFSMANADQMVAQSEITAHYIAKAGILILTRTLAKQLAPFQVTVNAVSPGFIDSGSAPPGELSGMAKRIPAGYIGEVRDTVAAVRFLLSEEARYVNGTNIHVSGGWGV